MGLFIVWWMLHIYIHTLWLYKVVSFVGNLRFWMMCWSHFVKIRDNSIWNSHMGWFSRFDGCCISTLLIIWSCNLYWKFNILDDVLVTFWRDLDKYRWNSHMGLFNVMDVAYLTLWLCKVVSFVENLRWWLFVVTFWCLYLQL